MGVENNFYLTVKPPFIRTMENLLLILATSFVLRISSPRKVGAHFIGTTGCSVLFMNGPVFEKTKTESGDDLYFNEYEEQGVTYGLICIDMQHHYELPEATQMLATYMHKLKGPFYIFHNIGHEKAADWNHTKTATLVDYWQDAVGVDCKVKGYTNGRILAVLYVKNISEAEVSRQDLFLDSFHFGDC